MQRWNKTFGNFEYPEIRSLLYLVESQSKRTLCVWSIAYAQEHLLPIYDHYFPNDSRPSVALENALGWLEGRVKFADAKETNNGAHNAATDAEGNPAAQAAARAIAHAALSIHVSAHSLGIAFYGSAAIAYARAGLFATQEEYLAIARQSWAEMGDALAKIARTDEQNPAKINTEFWRSRLR